METSIPMILHCPECKEQHIDEDEWATTRLHKTHLCLHCGHLWRPMDVPTVGVKNDEGSEELRGLRAAASESLLLLSAMAQNPNRTTAISLVEQICSALKKRQ